MKQNEEVEEGREKREERERELLVKEQNGGVRGNSIIRFSDIMFLNRC